MIGSSEYVARAGASSVFVYIILDVIIIPRSGANSAYQNAMGMLCCLRQLYIASSIVITTLKVYSHTQWLEVKVN